MAIAITVVHDEALVVLQVDDEFLELGKELRLLGTGLGMRSQPSLSSRCNAG